MASTWVPWKSVHTVDRPLSLRAAAAVRCVRGRLSQEEAPAAAVSAATQLLRLFSFRSVAVKDSSLCKGNAIEVQDVMDALVVDYDRAYFLTERVMMGGLPVPAGCHRQESSLLANVWCHNELDQLGLKLSEVHLQAYNQSASKLGISSADTSTNFILRRISGGERPQFGQLRKGRCLKPLVGCLPNMSTSMTNCRCECYDLYDKCVPYMDAWTWQRAMVEKTIATIREGSDVNDAILILQHSPVYTMGTQSSDEFLLFDKEQPPCDFYRTERGGEITYHGPGQLVMYPILNLRHYQMDLHWYLRSLEEVVIRALWSACAIEATRIKGMTGVWVGNEKVAAIGVRVSRWVTYHGLALNVTTDLSPFKRIVPCGISTRSVGSVHEILCRQSRPQRGQDLLNISTEKLLDLLHKKLLHEFSEVFGLDLSYAKKDLSISSANSYI